MASSVGSIKWRKRLFVHCGWPVDHLWFCFCARSSPLQGSHNNIDIRGESKCMEIVFFNKKENKTQWKVSSLANDLKSKLHVDEL